MRTAIASSYDMRCRDEQVRWIYGTSRIAKSLGGRQKNVVTSLPRPIVSSSLESDKLHSEDTRLMFAHLIYGDRLCGTIVARRFPAMRICRESQPPGPGFRKVSFRSCFTNNGILSLMPRAKTIMLQMISRIAPVTVCHHCDLQWYDTRYSTSILHLRQLHLPHWRHPSVVSGASARALGCQPVSLYGLITQRKSFR